MVVYHDKNLIINYIPRGLDDASLNELFSTIGRVKSCRIIRNKHTNNSFGFGFCEYENAECASKAINKFNGYQLGGNSLKVSFARVQTSNTSNNLYIKGFPAWVTESDVMYHFGQFGRIVQCRVLRDYETQEPKCAAYILFQNINEAEAAKNRFDGSPWPDSTDSNCVRVRYASPPHMLTSNNLQPNGPQFSNNSSLSQPLLTQQQQPSLFMPTNNQQPQYPQDFNAFGNDTSNYFLNQVNQLATQLLATQLQQPSSGCNLRYPPVGLAHPSQTHGVLAPTASPTAGVPIPGSGSTIVPQAIAMLPHHLYTGQYAPNPSGTAAVATWPQTYTDLQVQQISGASLPQMLSLDMLTANASSSLPHNFYAPHAPIEAINNSVCVPSMPLSANVSNGVQMRSDGFLQSHVTGNNAVSFPVLWSGADPSVQVIDFTSKSLAQSSAIQNKHAPSVSNIQHNIQNPSNNSVVNQKQTGPNDMSVISPSFVGVAAACDYPQSNQQFSSNPILTHSQHGQCGMVMPMNQSINGCATFPPVLNNNNLSAVASIPGLGCGGSGLVHNRNDIPRNNTRVRGGGRNSTKPQMSFNNRYEHREDGVGMPSGHNRSLSGALSYTFNGGNNTNMNNSLYVYNIGNSMSEAKLYELFSRFGDVVSVSIPQDANTGCGRNFGFVLFKSYRSALLAIEMMNGFKLQPDRFLQVSFKRPSVNNINNTLQPKTTLPTKLSNQNQNIIKHKQGNHNGVVGNSIPNITGGSNRGVRRTSCASTSNSTTTAVVNDEKNFNDSNGNDVKNTGAEACQLPDSNTMARPSVAFPGLSSVGCSDNCINFVAVAP